VADVTEWLTTVPPAAAYAVAALLVFAETGLIVGLVLPGEVTLLFVGFLCSLGTMNPWFAGATLIVAGLAGDSIAFVEGKRLGRRIEASRLGRWVGEDRWARTDALLDRHGGRAVFLGRYVAFARTLMPRLAATAGMPYRRFLPWDVLGVTTQVVASIALGYAAGGSYLLAAEVMGRATGAFLLLLLVIVALVVFGRYLGTHPDPVTSFGDRIGQWGPLRLLDRGYDAVFRWLTERLGVGGAVAASVLLGVSLLLGAGVVLTVVIDALVASSGIPLVDPWVADWLAEQRTPRTVDAATTTLLVLRGSFLVIAAGVAGLLLNRRPARWRADVLGVVGTVGAFIPLLILALATDFARPDRPAPGTAEPGMFPNQVTLVTASVGMVAWLLTRQALRWGARVAGWIVAVGVVIVVSAARLYVGWDWPSEVVASIVLGALWVFVFAVAWRTRDRVRAADPEAEKSLVGTPRAT
jgi:membrane protein DedA with SNARE-associated domain/membrane-associated phospholipid phosphatase